MQIPPSGMGMPSQVPPTSMPAQTPSASAAQPSTPLQSLRTPVPQQGIGMNRPVYVPGYDQTQSGEPLSKTTTPISPPLSAVAGDSDKGDDPPVCKRIEGLDEVM